MCEVVLDLDHTLVNSFEYGQSVGCMSGEEECLVQPHCSEFYVDADGEPELYHGSICRVLLLIKLRPGVRQFIRTLSEQTRIHVYTKGAKKYMDTVINLIDPEGRYILGTKCSRDDESIISEKKDPRNISTDKDLVVFDDSPHVWPNHVRVHTAKRYDFTERFSHVLRLSLVGSKFKLPTDSDFFLLEASRVLLEACMPSTPTAPSEDESDDSPMGRLINKLLGSFFTK
jgi:NLI interacting factor-like phosphatase